MNLFMVLIAVTGLCSASSAVPTTLVEFVAEFEGFRSSPYVDGDHMAVGYGVDTRWLDRHGYPSKRVTQPQAKHVLGIRLAEEYDALCKTLIGFENMPDGVKLALCSARFNSPNLIGPNLTHHVVSGEWETASLELALGHNPRGRYGLVRRRFAEANLIREATGLNRLAVPKNMGQFAYMKKLWKQGRI